MRKESNVPAYITQDHIGMSVLYRIANQSCIFEGVIESLSPEKEYVKVGRHWIPNGKEYVLSFLKTSKRRKDAFGSNEEK